MSPEYLYQLAAQADRPAGNIPAVMHAAAAHIEDLERKLREAEARVAELEAERTEREKQEPIDWYCDGEDGREYNGCPQMSNGRTGIPLYAAPPVTAPVRLTDEEIKSVLGLSSASGLAARIARLTEDAVLERNGLKP